MVKKIAIIGGGIVGSTAAYYLARSGHTVTVFDHGIGQATRASAGIICPWFSLRRNKPWYFLVSKGAEFYHQFMQDLKDDGYNTDAIYQIDGTIMIRNTDKRVQKDLDQAEAKQEASPSIGEVKKLSTEDISDYLPLIESDHPATWVEGGGRVHGDALIDTLHQAIQDLGGKIIREKAQLKKESGDIYISTPSVAKHNFDRLLLSPGPGLTNLLEPLGYKVDIRAQKGQLFVLKHTDWIDQHWPVIMPPGQSDIIPFNNGEIIIGATHEDDQGNNLHVDEAVLNELRDEARKWMPSVADHDIVESKVGTRAHTSDFSVLVGAVPNLDNVWAVSGLGSSGLTSGPFLGYQWAQLVESDAWDIDKEAFPIEKYIQANDAQ